MEMRTRPVIIKEFSLACFDKSVNYFDEEWLKSPKRLKKKTTKKKDLIFDPDSILLPSTAAAAGGGRAAH